MTAVTAIRGGDQERSIASMYLNERGRELVARTAALGRGFAERAARYDEEVIFPKEDFDDLVAAGLNAPTIPERYGGLGLGPFAGDVFTLWMMTKEVAKADLSLARCWEGHGNSLVLIGGMGTEAQKQRWFEGVTARAESWVVWSGEPQSRAPSETAKFGTHLERVDGGYRLTGKKAFCTSAGGATWALLLVSTAGPGGARHATGAAADTVLLAACDLRDPSITVDPRWWDPIGMRGTVSHVVEFDRTFIPDENILGEPGQYLRESWQTCFVPQYAASFLGAAEAAYEYALDYIRCQHKSDDPYVQHHVAKMTVNVETAHLWLRHVATLWESGALAPSASTARQSVDEARLAGSRARHIVEHLALETVDHAVRACGARVLNAPSPVERIVRDLAIYVRHDNDDQVLATIGKSVLGKSFDSSFYKP